jgi:hypothetical protein
MATRSKLADQTEAGCERTEDALEGWFATPLAELPDERRAIVERIDGFGLWDGTATDPRGALAQERRRELARQYDDQHDPATERLQLIAFRAGFSSAMFGELRAALDAEDDAASARLWLRFRKRHRAKLRKLVTKKIDKHKQTHLAAGSHRKSAAARGGALVTELTKESLVNFVHQYRNEYEGARGVWKAAAKRFQVSDETIARRRQEWSIN